MTIQEWLREKDACNEARAWAEGKTWSEIYWACPRGAWLLWLFRRTNPRNNRLSAKAQAAFDAAVFDPTCNDMPNVVRSVLTFEAFNTPWEEV